MDDLLQEFVAETRETLEALAGEIVAWEADPADKARLDAIFRFVHTVKGSCGFVDLPRLARLSHAAEDALAAVRSGERTPDTRLVNAVLAIVDRIGEVVEAIDAGRSLDHSSEDLLIAALDEGAAVEAVAAERSIARAPTRSVRLSVDLLDRMMSGMSDMVLARNELSRRLRGPAVDPRLEAAMDRLSATVAEMRDTVTRTRMQTIEALFSALPRLVRDTAAEVGKAVALRVDGGDVELDREMIEMMRDPLVHMIRNAIDHGIEAPADRRTAGKRETGQLTVSARQSGNRILIEITDDGRGIDTDRLIAKAVAADPRRENELRLLGERARAALVFEPGLTSRDQASAISGRGVGMDVVRANVEQIGGRIELDNRPGRGLTVAIHVPLTLSILPAVTVSVGEGRYAVPRQAIEEIVATGSDAVHVDRIGDAPVLTLRERRLPMVDAGAFLGRGDRIGAPPMVMIVDVPGGTYALGVDAIDDTEELVVKPAAPAVMAAGIYAGQTLPDSGLPMLLVDCAGLAAAAGLTFERVEAVEEIAAAATVPGVSALVFDDLDGARRAVPLAAIDRIEQAQPGAIARTGGRLRLTAEQRTIPLVAIDEARAETAPALLRFRDGDAEFAYAIEDAVDIVSLPEDVAPAAGTGGLVGGVVLIDGEAIELLDPLLLVTAAEERAGAAAPICLLQGGEAQWMKAMLRQSIEAAGYRVVTRLAPGEIATVVLAMEGDALSDTGGAIVRLARARGTGIYRQDRAALMTALAEVREAA